VRVRPCDAARQGFILARGSAVGLPITTINVSKVGIRRLSRERARHHGFARDRYDATYPGSQPITNPTRSIAG